MELKQVVIRGIQWIPSDLIRWFGAAQFRFPFLKPLIQRAGRFLTNTEGVISYGVGKGLKINGQHGFPGYLLGTTEPEQQIWLSQNIRNGDVVYDIGANVGFFALICAKLTGDDGRVEAFEPNPVCACSCRYNIELNNFHNTTVHDLAVSDSNSITNFEIPENSTALGRISRGNDGTSENQGLFLVVRTARLDDYVMQCGLQPPNLMLIDVEGHELQVLRGATETIKKHLPKINCEVHWLGDAFLDYFERELKPLGYDLQTIDQQAIPSQPERWQAVLVAKHAKHSSAVNSALPMIK